MKAQKYIFYPIVFICLSFSANILAADLQASSDLFSKHFRGSFYKENKCGENVEILIRTALRERIDVAGASLIYLENTGSWNFGLIDAYRARGQGPFVDSDKRDERSPGKANWGFHVFMLVEGRVLDFDFENQPRVLPLSLYISEMFFGPSDSVDLRTRKLRTYKASVYRIKAIGERQAFSAKISELLEMPVEMALQDLLATKG